MIVEVPNTWQVRLKSGNTLGLIADSYSQHGENYVFNLLVDATQKEQEDPHLMVTARTPSNPERVLIAVASIPVADVIQIETAKWETIPEAE